MTWTLPTSVDIDGVEYKIRTDYRCILDILSDLSNPEADGKERAYIVLIGLYPDFATIPPEHYEKAISKGLRFINCDSKETPKKAPRLVDWEQDYGLIIGPINRVIGQEVRSVPYLHWWTFMASYMEIGDCTFAQVVRIRDHLSRGKKLDKADREWYRQNRELVDFKNKYTTAEKEILKEWCGV